MAGNTDPSAPRTWVAIDIAKGSNVALVEHDNGRRQRFRFGHNLQDYDRLVAFLRSVAIPCRIAFEPTADYHRTLSFRRVSEGFDVALVSSNCRSTSAQAPDDPDLKRKARTAVTAKMAGVVYAKNDGLCRPRFELSLPSGSTPLIRAVEALGTS